MHAELARKWDTNAFVTEILVLSTAYYACVAGPVALVLLYIGVGSLYGQTTAGIFEIVFCSFINVMWSCVHLHHSCGIE